MSADDAIGNVQTQLDFRKVDDLTIPLGFGLGPLNTTIAEQLSMLTDILFGATFSQFLLDPNHAVDITPTGSRKKSCSQGIDVRVEQTCERVVFLAAGLDKIGSEVATVSEYPKPTYGLQKTTRGISFITPGGAPIGISITRKTAECTQPGCLLQPLVHL